MSSHSNNDLLPPKKEPLLHPVIPPDTKKTPQLSVQPRQCRREKAYVQIKRSLFPQVIVVIRLRKLLILHFFCLKLYQSNPRVLIHYFHKSNGGSPRES